ncbi:MAG: NAD(P)/FAD-dependent oxidoreductase, partial [Desulfitobacteriaceae bacterium]|nr:NAD(P)/FAD-dependent oxidoreductase [Desulfitobacteriaceae bacterium]
MSERIIIVGGGAAGLMAAVTAARRKLDVTVVERMPKPGRKIMITGKGRCNVTNNTDLNGLIAAVTKNGRFLYSAFSKFSAEDTISFFENAGIKLKTERGNRVFPQSDKSSDIVDALVNSAKRAGVKFVTGRVKRLLVNDGKVTGIECDDGRIINSDATIISTGGKSYPLTGSTGDGYELAASVGHTIMSLRPSLVPLVVREGWCSSLQGLSLKNVAVTVSEKDRQKPVFSDFGELMLTHYGLSGPIALSASAHMSKVPETHYYFDIDLKPALDEAKLDARILRDFEKYSKKNYSNAIQDLLPSKLIPVVIKLSQISPEEKVNQITKEQRLKLINVLKRLRLEVIGLRPIEEAVVTSGGVKVGEIDPKTMKSKVVDGL